MLYKLLFSCFLLFSCGKGSRYSSTPVTLLVNLNDCSEIKLNDSRLRICLDSVKDSRCPANAQCVWAGYASANLRMQLDGTEFPLRLSTLSNPLFGTNDTTIASHRIQLVNVTPYPGTQSNSTKQVEVKID